MSYFENYSDEKLLVLINNSDAGAFAELYNRYWKKMFSIAANKLGNIPDAEELVQDIFLDIWKRREQLHITGEAKAYLAVAVKYKIINVLAKKNREEEFKKERRLASSDSDDGLRNWLSFEDLKKRLSLLVADLPKKCQLVYKLSREEGYSRKEISKVLNISEKTVESHLTRALRSLRGNLQNMLPLFFF